MYGKTIDVNAGRIVSYIHGLRGTAFFALGQCTSLILNKTLDLYGISYG